MHTVSTGLFSFTHSFRRISLGVLLIAAFALVDCEPPPPPPQVATVTTQAEEIHARGSSISAVSQDGGQNWRDDGQEKGYYSSSMQLEPVCQSQLPLICYRLLPEQVQESADGGVTWHTAWQVSQVRHEFLERRASDCGIIGGCIKQFDPGPYDMTLAEPTGTNGLQTLIVALGGEGVLVRTPEGVWQQYGVQGAQPTPERAADLGQALSVLQTEYSLVWLVTPFAFLFVCFSSWKWLLQALRQTGRKVSLSWVYVLMFVSGVLFFETLWQRGLTFFTPIRLTSWLVEFYYSQWFPLLILIPVPLGLVIGYALLARAAPRKRYVIIAAVWSLLFIVVAVLVWLLPLLGWAFGVIPFYYPALIGAVILLLVWVWWSWQQLKRITRVAAR